MGAVASRRAGRRRIGAKRAVTELEICSHTYVLERDMGGSLRSPVTEAPSTIPTSQIANPDTEYEYERLKLEYDEIRLVKIHPGKDFDPVQCSIWIFELASAPEYAAVSYTWATEDGDASMSQRILVRDEAGSKTARFLKITANCEAALQELRSTDEERVVWIDSICINQNRVSERNQQVKMMDRIYWDASRVDICIRAPNHDLQGALTWLAHDNAIMAHREGVKIPDFAAEPNFVQLKKLFDLRYFSRAWVIQEVLLAREAILHLNGIAVPFRQETLHFIEGTVSLHSCSLPRLMRWVSAWTKSSSIMSCLNMSLNSLASDPRDQVYAITGLLEPEIRVMIPVIYMLSLEQVFTSAVTACIAECGDLRILKYVQPPEDSNFFTTSCFGEEHFKRFIEREAYKTGVKSQDVGDQVTAVCGNAQAQVLVPPGQLLPRLRLLARPIATCIGPINQSLNDLSEQLAKDVNPLPDWSWNSIGKERDYRQIATFIGRIKAASPFPHDPALFQTRNSAGVTYGHFLPGDVLFYVDSSANMFLLREAGANVYRVVGQCYILGRRVSSSEHGNGQLDSGGLYEQQRTIEIY